MATTTSQAQGAIERCRICGASPSHAQTHRGVESCCATCLLILDWFKDWLDREAGVAPDNVDLSSSLVHLHRGDSFGLVELLMELEDEFGVTIPQDPGIHLETIEDAIRCIRLKSSPAVKREPRRFWSRTG
jgi:acyl carrier protein